MERVNTWTTPSALQEWVCRWWTLKKQRGAPGPSQQGWRRQWGALWLGSILPSLLGA